VTLKKKINACAYNDSGVAAVEFAIVAPIILLIAFAMADFSLMLTKKTRVSQSVQEASLIAMQAAKEDFAKVEEQLATLQSVNKEFCSDDVCQESSSICDNNETCHVKIYVNETYDYRFGPSKLLFGNQQVIFEQTTIYFK
jgi:Flp pilus assembly protein TadG